MRFYKVQAFLIVSLACTAYPAYGQDSIASPVISMDVMTGVAAMESLRQSEERRATGIRRVYHPTATSSIAAAFSRGAPIGARAPVRLSYTATPALRKQAEAGMVQRLRKKSPAVADQLAAQLQRYDFSRIYAGIVRPFGLRTDDAADAVTAYTLLGYLIASGAPNPSPTAVRAVRDRIAADLASDPNISRQRGLLGEEMKVLFVTLHAGWQSARREGNLSAFADGVANLFRQQAGVDLRRVRLTDQGFVAR